MTQLRRAIMIAAIAALTASCGGKVGRSTYEVLPDGRSLVRVWIQDHPDLDVDAMVDGCGVWWPENLVCEQEKVAEQADIRVYADDGPCVKDADGHYVLATAYGDATIVFNDKCLDRDKNGAVVLRELHGVMGHEVGHELGIWDHVPLECTGGEKVAPDGERVCGQALMNPNYDVTVDSMTWADQLAFDVRPKDPSRPAPPPDGIADSSPICTFRSK